MRLMDEVIWGAICFWSSCNLFKMTLLWPFSLEWGLKWREDKARRVCSDSTVDEVFILLHLEYLTEGVLCILGCYHSPLESLSIWLRVVKNELLYHSFALSNEICVLMVQMNFYDIGRKDIHDPLNWFIPWALNKMVMPHALCPQSCSRTLSYSLTLHSMIFL